MRCLRLRVLLVLIFYCRTLHMKDILEEIQLNDENPSELNLFLEDVMKYKKAFKMIRRAASDSDNDEEVAMNDKGIDEYIYDEENFAPTSSKQKQRKQEYNSLKNNKMSLLGGSNRPLNDIYPHIYKDHNEPVFPKKFSGNQFSLDKDVRYRRQIGETVKIEPKSCVGVINVPGERVKNLNKNEEGKTESNFRNDAEETLMTIFKELGKTTGSNQNGILPGSTSAAESTTPSNNQKNIDNIVLTTMRSLSNQDIPVEKLFDTLTEDGKSRESKKEITEEGKSIKEYSLNAKEKQNTASETWQTTQRSEATEGYHSLKSTRVGNHKQSRKRKMSGRQSIKNIPEFVGNIMKEIKNGHVDKNSRARIFSHYKYQPYEDGFSDQFHPMFHNNKFEAIPLNNPQYLHFEPQSKRNLNKKDVYDVKSNSFKSRQLKQANFSEEMVQRKERNIQEILGMQNEDDYIEDLNFKLVTTTKRFTKNKTESSSRRTFIIPKKVKNKPLASNSVEDLHYIQSTTPSFSRATIQVLTTEDHFESFPERKIKNRRTRTVRHQKIRKLLSRSRRKFEPNSENTIPNFISKNNNMFENMENSRSSRSSTSSDSETNPITSNRRTEKRYDYDYFFTDPEYSGFTAHQTQRGSSFGNKRMLRALQAQRYNQMYASNPSGTIRRPDRPTSSEKEKEVNNNPNKRYARWLRRRRAPSYYRAQKRFCNFQGRNLKSFRDSKCHSHRIHKRDIIDGVMDEEEPTGDAADNLEKRTESDYGDEPDLSEAQNFQKHSKLKQYSRIVTPSKNFEDYYEYEEVPQQRSSFFGHKKNGWSGKKEKKKKIQLKKNDRHNSQVSLRDRLAKLKNKLFRSQPEESDEVMRDENPYNTIYDDNRRSERQSEPTLLKYQDYGLMNPYKKPESIENQDFDRFDRWFPYDKSQYFGFPGSYDQNSWHYFYQCPPPSRIATENIENENLDSRDLGRCPPSSDCYPCPCPYPCPSPPPCSCPSPPPYPCPTTPPCPCPSPSIPTNNGGKEELDSADLHDVDERSSWSDLDSNMMPVNEDEELNLESPEVDEEYSTNSKRKIKEHASSSYLNPRCRMNAHSFLCPRPTFTPSNRQKNEIKERSCSCDDPYQYQNPLNDETEDPGSRETFERFPPSFEPRQCSSPCPCDPCPPPCPCPSPSPNPYPNPCPCPSPSPPPCLHPYFGIRSCPLYYTFVTSNDANSNLYGSAPHNMGKRCSHPSYDTNEDSSHDQFEENSASDNPSHGSYTYLGPCLLPCSCFTNEANVNGDSNFHFERDEKSVVDYDSQEPSAPSASGSYTNPNFKPNSNSSSPSCPPPCPLQCPCLPPCIFPCQPSSGSSSSIPLSSQPSCPPYSCSVKCPLHSKNDELSNNSDVLERNRQMEEESLNDYFPQPIAQPQFQNSDFSDPRFTSGNEETKDKMDGLRSQPCLRSYSCKYDRNEGEHRMVFRNLCPHTSSSPCLYPCLCSSSCPRMYLCPHIYLKTADELDSKSERSSWNEDDHGEKERSPDSSCPCPCPCPLPPCPNSSPSPPPSPPSIPCPCPCPCPCIDDMKSELASSDHDHNTMKRSYPSSDTRGIDPESDTVSSEGGHEMEQRYCCDSTGCCPGLYPSFSTNSFQNACPNPNSNLCFYPCISSCPTPGFPSDTPSDLPPFPSFPPSPSSLPSGPLSPSSFSLPPGSPYSSSSAPQSPPLCPTPCSYPCVYPCLIPCPHSCPNTSTEQKTESPLPNNNGDTHEMRERNSDTGYLFPCSYTGIYSCPYLFTSNNNEEISNDESKNSVKDHERSSEEIDITDDDDDGVSIEELTEKPFLTKERSAEDMNPNSCSSVCLIPCQTSHPSSKQASESELNTDQEISSGPPESIQELNSPSKSILMNADENLNPPPRPNSCSGQNSPPCPFAIVVPCNRAKESSKVNDGEKSTATCQMPCSCPTTITIPCTCTITFPPFSAGKLFRRPCSYKAQASPQSEESIQVPFIMEDRNERDLLSEKLVKKKRSLNMAEEEERDTVRTNQNDEQKSNSPLLHLCTWIPQCSFHSPQIIFRSWRSPYPSPSSANCNKYAGSLPVSYMLVEPHRCCNLPCKRQEIPSTCVSCSPSSTTSSPVSSFTISSPPPSSSSTNSCSQRSNTSFENGQVDFYNENENLPPIIQEMPLEIEKEKAATKNKRDLFSCSCSSAQSDHPFVDDDQNTQGKHSMKGRSSSSCDSSVSNPCSCESCCPYPNDSSCQSCPCPCDPSSSPCLNPSPCDSCASSCSPPCPCSCPPPDPCSPPCPCSPPSPCSPSCPSPCPTPTPCPSPTCSSPLPCPSTSSCPSSTPCCRSTSGVCSCSPQCSCSCMRQTPRSVGESEHDINQRCVFGCLRIPSGTTCGFPTSFPFPSSGSFPWPSKREDAERTGQQPSARNRCSFCYDPYHFSYSVYNSPCFWEVGNCAPSKDSRATCIPGRKPETWCQMPKLCPLSHARPFPYSPIPCAVNYGIPYPSSFLNKRECPIYLPGPFSCRAVFYQIPGLNPLPYSNNVPRFSVPYTIACPMPHSSFYLGKRSNIDQLQMDPSQNLAYPQFSEPYNSKESINPFIPLTEGDNDWNIPLDSMEQINPFSKNEDRYVHRSKRKSHDQFLRERSGSPSCYRVVPFSNPSSYFEPVLHSQSNNDAATNIDDSAQSSNSDRDSQTANDVPIMPCCPNPCPPSKTCPENMELPCLSRYSNNNLMAPTYAKMNSRKRTNFHQAARGRNPMESECEDAKKRKCPKPCEPLPPCSVNDPCPTDESLPCDDTSQDMLVGKTKFNRFLRNRDLNGRYVMNCQKFPKNRRRLTSPVCDQRNENLKRQVRRTHGIPKKPSNKKLPQQNEEFSLKKGNPINESLPVESMLPHKIHKKENTGMEDDARNKLNHRHSNPHCGTTCSEVPETEKCEVKPEDILLTRKKPYAGFQDVNFAKELVEAIMTKVNRNSNLKLKIGNALNKKRIYETETSQRNYAKISSFSEKAEYEEARNLLKTVSFVLNKLVKKQIEERLCEKLPSHLKTFLKRIVRPPKHKISQRHDDKYHEDTFLFKASCPPSKLDPDTRSHLEVDLLKLLDRYNQLDEDSRKRAAPLKGYIASHLDMLKRMKKGERTETSSDHTLEGNDPHDDFDVRTPLGSKTPLNMAFLEKEANKRPQFQHPSVSNINSYNNLGNIVEEDMDAMGKKSKKRTSSKGDYSSNMDDEDGASEENIEERKTSRKYNKLVEAANEARLKRNNEAEIGKAFGRNVVNDPEIDGQNFDQVGFDTPKVFTRVQ